MINLTKNGFRIVEEDILKVPEKNETVFIFNPVDCTYANSTDLNINIQDKFDGVFSGYTSKVEKAKNASKLLGDTQIFQTDSDNMFVINIFASDIYGKKGRRTNANAFNKGLKKINAVIAMLLQSNISNLNKVVIKFPYMIGTYDKEEDFDKIEKIIYNRFFDIIYMMNNSLGLDVELVFCKSI